MTDVTSSANTTDEIKRLGDTEEARSVAFARFGPDTGPCLGGCGKETPLAHLGELTFQTNCTKCEERSLARAEAEDRKAIVDQLIEKAGPPRRFRDWSLETYPTDEWGVRGRAVAEDWIANHLGGSRRNLILWGNTGGGKSGLAWAICRALCEEQVACRFVNFLAALNEIRAAVGEKRSIREDWKRVPVLVLDDVGSERPSGFAREQLVGLVDYRWSEDLATIYTSNMPLGALAERLSPDDPDFVEGKRIVSRMRDGATVIHLDAPDRRLR